MNKRLNIDFYRKDVLEVAPLLLGKLLVIRLDSGEIIKRRITETEAYRGKEDSACHARFGLTKRTEVLYKDGGHLYVYLCYGIHYLLNIVTGCIGDPQAVLIRGVEGFNGPGKLTKALNINLDFNNTNLRTSDKIWIEDDDKSFNYYATKRIGIEYATEPYKSIKWRYVLKT
ncbi:MAG: DNA-3-methyladenine glycosylase [Clostridia bacterium]|nr:DNA-3-methyladenine glycosylase [Clostridia bacterium]